MPNLRKIWAHGFVIVRQTWTLGAMAILALVALTIWEELSGKSLASSSETILWLFVAYFMQDTILRGEYVPRPPKSERRIWAFMWRSLVLIIVPTVLSFALVIGTGIFAGSPPNVIVLYLIATLTVLVWLFMSWFGTWPTAAVARGNASFGAAWARGRRTFWSTLYLLAFGPGVCIIASLIALFALNIALTSFGVPKVVSISAAVGVGSAISVLGTAITALILCSAYQVGEIPSDSEQNRGERKAE